MLPLRNIFRRKIRTLITILGVAIGISLFTTAISFSQGFQKQIQEIIKNLSIKYNVRLWGIEAIQYQSALVHQASAIGIPVKEIKPYTDKFTRAIPIAAMLEAGRIFFPDYADWLNDFEQELTQFPEGKHDDQVDAFAYITEIYKENNIGQIVGKKISRNVFAHF